MSTKLISILIISLVVWVGYRVYVYWEDIQQNKDLERQKASTEHIRPDHLAGMPYHLSLSYDAAQRKGADALRAWFREHGDDIHDPRKAWIQLDYCITIARDDPQEARRIFASVKKRTPKNSPVYPRVKQLESTFD